ncbi:butyrophilin subfamily 2 member A1-like isoform X4 [Acanthopagrus latus]|uniref:butyrophilin subfamily 2 member A1-like isoform X4 n=1 Tax=Acanthopagrus latus TaxID=8177 RepID=UPI00187C6085|nr:butyrophilin subfamily 2 member A1-like isoform X4 [Acanthopagrus latus]
MQLMMFLVFVCVGTFPAVISGYRAVCPTEPIKAQEGLNVTLQCGLDPRVNLLDYTSDWNRADLDKFVHVYRHRRDDPDPQLHVYRGRTALVHEDLSRGVLTLLISSVQLSDAGPYRCFVPNLKAGCTMKLTVGQRETASTPRPPLDLVTQPDLPDGENRNAVRAGIISTLFLLPIVVMVVLVVRSRRTQEEEENKEQEEQL